MSRVHTVWHPEIGYWDSVEIRTWTERQVETRGLTEMEEIRKGVRIYAVDLLQTLHKQLLSAAKLHCAVAVQLFVPTKQLEVLCVFCFQIVIPSLHTFIHSYIPGTPCLFR